MALLSVRLLGVAICLIAFARQGSAKLDWRECDPGEFETNLTISCTSVRVPVDYSLPDSEELDLQIVRVPAAISPAKGSILHNFGGPGGEARHALTTLGPVLLALSGGAYDLLAFDARGTGVTLPFECVANGSFYAGQFVNEIRAASDTDTALRRLWARGEVDGNICRELGNANSTGELIGTAYTARDFISVVDALDEDGLLRYWGFSYGTTLGATLAAMFPERIDRMVLDGVQNPHEYYYANADFEEWSDSDEVFSFYFSSCIEAGPSKCALASFNKTAAQLEADTYSFFDFVRDNPQPFGLNVLDVTAVKGLVILIVREPSLWPISAPALADALYGSGQAFRDFAALFADFSVGPVAVDAAENLWGIHCSDRVPRVEDFEDIKPDFDRLIGMSRLFGDVAAPITAHCAQWPWHAKEVYKGDFRVETRDAVLIAGNIRDSHTPIRSAFNISDGFAGSRVLQVNGTGHTTINVPSACTLEQTAAYWVNGTLPEEGFVCDAASPWDSPSWADILGAIAGAEEIETTIS